MSELTIYRRPAREQHSACCTAGPQAFQLRNIPDEAKHASLLRIGSRQRTQSCICVHMRLLGGSATKHSPRNISACRMLCDHLHTRQGLQRTYVRATLTKLHALLAALRASLQPQILHTAAVGHAAEELSIVRGSSTP